MTVGLLRETGARSVGCRALHHLERSVDWKLWGRELRELRTRPFFLLLSPARHWLRRSRVLPDPLQRQILFLWQAAPGGKPDIHRTRLPGPFAQPCRVPALLSGLTMSVPTPVQPIHTG